MVWKPVGTGLRRGSAHSRIRIHRGAGFRRAYTTHIVRRVWLKSELPIVNTATTDPTIPETVIPWLLTAIQDDRVQGYTLARRIYTEVGLHRVALLRVNERYGRLGVVKFHDASSRLSRAGLNRARIRDVFYGL